MAEYGEEHEEHGESLEGEPVTGAPAEAEPARRYGRRRTRASVATTPVTDTQYVNDQGQVVEEVDETPLIQPSDQAAQDLTAIKQAQDEIKAIYQTVINVQSSDQLADFLFKLQQAELSLMDLELYTEAQQSAYEEEQSHAST